MADEDDEQEDQDEQSGQDIALSPGPGSDSNDEVRRFVPKDICDLYEVYSYKHAAAVLRSSCSVEFDEILDALRRFRLTTDEIKKPGGNESDIPKAISGLLRSKHWCETRIHGDLLITLEINESENGNKKKVVRTEQLTRENFLDGHKVDYVKNQVAFDLEWNSKDQTFDRDLYAFRAFSECGLVSAGIIVTRSASLNSVFEAMGERLDKNGKPILKRNGKPRLVKEKYGASTTWMGKLLYRLNAGRNGGCPVLVLGITPKLISDWGK